MKKQLMALLVAAILATAGSTAFGVGPGTIVLAQDPTFLGDGSDFPGMWEYVYDVYGDSKPVDRVGLSGFDASAIENQWPWSGWDRTGTLHQKWDFHVAHDPVYYERDAYGSYAVGGTGPWILDGKDWSMDNPWHTPDEYSAVGGFPSPAFIWAGKIADDDQSLTFISSHQNRVASGLLLTFRIVHPRRPGEINWSLLSLRQEGQSSGTIRGPAPPLPGDFDGDGDVDADDIDELCRVIRGGTPDPDFDYNLDGLNGIDSDDMDMLIHDLVETTAGVGSEYGDFDLNGTIDTTDLTILATNFGVGSNWAEGNANCDAFIDTTDLAILATNFGFVTSGAVPEPATMSLFALGGLALLRRRK